MGKIKHTKNELKAQRDALQRYERYLPTLVLKKQQLQAEVRRVGNEEEVLQQRQQALREQQDAWVALFSEPFDFPAHLRIKAVHRSEGNIAGVVIPLLDALEFVHDWPDPAATPVWVDAGLRALEEMLRLEIEREIVAEQRRRLELELLVTSQRVNLFEKIMIPQCRDAIRVIRIFLGDQQTAAVARAKIAKGKSVEKVRSA